MHPIDVRGGSAMEGTINEIVEVSRITRDVFSRDITHP